MKYFQSLFLRSRLFISAGILVLLFLVGYMLPVIFIAAQSFFLLICALIIYDLFLLYGPNRKIKATRLCAARLSNGDENLVQIVLECGYPLKVFVNLIDEIPPQFQRRNVNFKAVLRPGETKTIEYHLRPVTRGVYDFGLLRVYLHTSVGLLKRRFNCDAHKQVEVFPSYLQLKKYELMAISNNLVEHGIKKVRKIGHNIEFEHIKEYIKGDDFRTVNWKATARKNELMVNLYQDEKSQNVYCLIDKGRMMQMPFDGMSLLDYAINSSLVISNIALRKEDKAGIMTFEKGFDGFLPASRRRNQMHLILNFLYNQSTTFGETDFSNLYIRLRHSVKKRSLLLLFTNFESIHSLDRQLQYFKKLAQSHLLVVIFFENTELEEMIHNDAKDTLGIYQKVIAEQFAFEKRQIVLTLRKHGIQAILTKPKEMSVNLINKYIELKARQLI
ncbi:MAG: DUF58 domain-containing protein [Cytophagales bacterium]|nr:DUF58 domain-containing protein [Cytophagales bacterium]